jgi:hypothetical protein
MNTILLLNKNHIDFLAEKLDNLKDFENPIIEGLDGPVAKLSINYLNKLGSPYIPDAVKPDLQAALDQVVEGDYSEAIDEAFDAVYVAIESTELKPGQKELIESLLKIIESVLVTLTDKG